MRGSWRQAARLFTGFFERDPEDEEVAVVTVPDPQVCIIVGKVLKITYRATGKEFDLEHTFEAENPLLAVSASGEQMFMIGGDYVFTERGFIG